MVTEPPLRSVRKVMVCHGTDTGIAPYVDSSLHHIYNGIDGEDDAEDGDRGVDARHQGEGEEVAPHGNTSIADGRDNGDKNPCEHGGPGEFDTPLLHHEE